MISLTLSFALHEMYTAFMQILDIYLTIVVTFVDGNTWELDVITEDLETEETEELLDSIAEEYEDSIDTIEFRLNMEKVKTDIQEMTSQFLKKKK